MPSPARVCSHAASPRHRFLLVNEIPGLKNANDLLKAARRLKYVFLAAVPPSFDGGASAGGSEAPSPEPCSRRLRPPPGVGLDEPCGALPTRDVIL